MQFPFCIKLLPLICKQQAYEELPINFQSVPTVLTLQQVVWLGIRQQFKFSFSDIQREHTEHKTVIVGFLAILELFKQGDLLVTQLNRFADIEVEREQSEIPRYY